LGVHTAQARTFHAAALRQLRYFWPQLVGEAPWDLIDHKLRLIGMAAHQQQVSTEADMLRDLAGEIEWAKASLIGPDDYPAAVELERRSPPVAAESVAKVYRAYERAKNDARQLDFDDLLLHTAAALSSDAGIAAEFRERYRCFVVDEYQDVTPAQQQLLDAWLGCRDDLTVVGDANQTIYSFTGASPRPLLRFTRRFPDATVVRLERDYRSTPQVVSLANRVIAAARDRPAGSRLKLVGQRPAAVEPRFHEYEDEPTEAAAVAGRIKELIESGVPASEIAVLYRVNVQSEAYEKALSDMDVPCLVRGGERFFSRNEVRQALAALRTAAANARHGDAEGAGLVAAVRQVLGPVGLTGEPPPGGNAREKWESLLALVELAEELAGVSEGAGLVEFVAELERRADARHPPKVEGVTLASLHAAKGLEWDAVFLIGLAEGTVPIQHADDDAGIEEERRLLYVGVTRAREHLWLSWALSRSSGGRRNRRRSRFLYGLIPEDHPAARMANARNGGGSAQRLNGSALNGSALNGNAQRCRVCDKLLTGAVATKLGRCDDCPSTVDEELLARLKQWRMDRAKELRKPPYVIFTDATLLAIAERQPTDTAALVSISGIGATKLEQFGSDVLTVIRG
ncbi:MAG: ATP-dependent DNA helicase UvrD2, partial [Sciscionella sp.]